jgi:hypothetical protein
MKRSVRWLIVGVVLAALGWYVWHAREQLGIITRFDLRYLAPMLAVALVQPLVNGWIGKRLAGEFGVRLSGLEAYALATINALGNYLPIPQAGAMARGLYLKRVHRLAYGRYAASVVVTYVSAAVLYGAAGLAGLTALWASGRVAPWELWLIFGALSSSVILFTPLSGLVPLPRRLSGVREGLAALRQHHVLSKIMTLQLCLVGLTSTGFWLACRALPGGEQVNWLMGLMMGLLVMASGVLNVTPGNLGVEQMVAMLTALLLRVDPSLAFLASSLYRAMAIVTIFSTGPILAAWLARQKPRPAPTHEVAHGGAS